MKRETEVRVKQPEAKEHLEPPDVVSVKEVFSLRAIREMKPCQRLDFSFSAGINFYFLFFFFFFLGLHLRHMKVPRLGVELELQLPA